MNNLVKELKKHLYILLVLVLICSNSYNIKLNTKHCNSNAIATIRLAGTTIVLCDSLNRLARGYTKYKDSIRVRNGIWGNQILENKANIFINEKQSEANTARDKKITGMVAGNTGKTCLNEQNINFNRTLFARNKENIEVNNERDKKTTAIVNENVNKIYLNEANIISNKECSILNKENIEEINKKPTHKYLKSVTVIVTGKEVNYDHTPPVSWCGTGVIVKVDENNTYILTNKHVVGGYDPFVSLISVKVGKKMVACDVVKLHESVDLALLKIEGTIPGKDVVRGLAYPEITEKVFTIGHSLARPFIYGEGVFSGTILKHDIYQIPGSPGQSGSGVFNKDGELLGLIYSGSGFEAFGNLQMDTTRTNVVKGFYIKKFLEENLK